MAKTVIFSMSARGQTRFVSLYAGEDIALRFNDLPSGARVIMSIAVDFDAAPLLQRTFTTQDALMTAESLVVIPEAKGCVYSIWLEQNDDIELVAQGSFLMLHSVAPILQSGGPALANLRPPSISGEAIVGQTLTLDIGDWQGEDSLRVDWLRDGSVIPGQTQALYQVVAGDEGLNLSASVTGFDTAGGNLVVPASGGGMVVWPTPTVVQGTGPFSFTVGVPVSIDLGTTFSGSDLAYSLAPSSAALPLGLSLSASGILAGTPAAVGGPAVILLRATNSGGSAEATFEVTVVEETLGFVVGSTSPRLIADGDSVMANRPGARDMITGYLGDVVYFPEGWMQAIGGQTAAEILAGIQGTINLITPAETIVLMGPMGANQTAGSSTVAEIWPQQQQVFDTLLAAGATVIAIPTLPDEDTYGNNVEKDALRDLVYAYQAGGTVTHQGTTYTVESHTNFHAVDIGVPDRGQSGSAAYGIGTFNPYSMKNDQSHPNTDLGAPFLANQIRAVLQPLVSGSAAPTAFDAQNLLGTDWNFPGSTAATATGTTGQRPTGWNVSRQTGTGTWTLSKNGEGNLVATITNSPDNSILQVSRSISFAGVEGDVFDMLAEIEVDPTTTEYRGASVSFRGTGGATAGSVTYGTPEFPLFIRSSGTPLSGNVTSDTARITVAVGPGGSGTFVFKRADLRWRENLSNSLMITGNPLQIEQVGNAYSFTPQVTGGAAPYVFDLASGSLPDGLTLDGSTGAITGTLTTTGAFTGIALRVTDALGNSAILPPFTITVTTSNVPVNTALPTISGAAIAEQTLTAAEGTWTNTPTSYGFQWLSSGFAIPGATAQSYVVQAADVGQTLSVEVEATNANGVGPVARSSETSVVQPASNAVVALDSSYNFGDPAQMAYTDSDRTLSATASISGIRFSRGTDSLIGKRYFEMATSSATHSVGVSTSAPTVVTGGANGVVRAYWSASQVFVTGGAVSIGQSFGAGDRVQIAIDEVARLIWFRKNGAGNWNNSTLADPETGSGGYNISGLIGPLYAYCGLQNNVSASVVLHGTADRFLYAPPAGFAPIG